MMIKTCYLLSYLIAMACSLGATVETEIPSTIAPKKLTPISCSEIFSYDTPLGMPGYLHVQLKGQTAKREEWSAQGVELLDIPFYQDLFNDESVMSNFGDGQQRTRESTTAKVTQTWLPRFAAGQPHGALTVFNATGKRIGFTLGGGGDREGTSELAQAYSRDVWGQGIGKSVRETIVNDWAPEVRRIGLGHGLQETEAAIAKSFQCFAGKPLDQLDATASPRNVASWKILLRQGFQPAVCEVDTEVEVIDLLSSVFEGQGDDEVEDYKQMEDHVLKTYFTQEAPSLVSGKRYPFVDHRGFVWTLSKHSRFGRLKFHFERKIEAKF